MQRLKELRLSHNLTQKQLAEKVSTTQTTIGKYERGELQPSLETLKQFSNLFECSIDYIIGHTDDFGNITIKNENMVPLSMGERQLLECFRLLSPTERERATEYMTFLAEKHKQ